MRRSFAGLIGSALMSTTATFAWMALATADEKAHDTAPPAPEKSAAPAMPQVANVPAPQKVPQHTTPEDGNAGLDNMKPSKQVLDLMAEYPGQDIIVCVAGCFDKRSRVIFAQPALPVALPAAEEVSEVPAPEATVEPAALAAEPQKPAAATEAKLPATAPAPSAASETATMPSFVPTDASNGTPATEDAAAPEAAEAPAENASPADEAPTGDGSGNASEPAQ